MSDKRKFLTFEDAVAMLPDKEEIHTFRNPGAALMVGSDWPREDIIEILRTGKPELGGATCTNMNHGLVIIDEDGPLFIETKRK